MLVELNKEQIHLLVELVDARVKDIHPEIRRSHHYNLRDELKHDQDVLQKMLTHLQEAEQQAES